MKHSELKFYSVGIVAEDIDPTSYDVEVFPIEVLGEVDGSLVSEDELIEEVNDGDGNITSIKIVKSKTLTCRWLPLEANRATAPTIHKGERVEIVRFANLDTLYWMPISNDTDLRRRELVVNMYASRPSILGDIDDSNSYVFTIDTINKFLEISTSIADKEPITFKLTLDTKNGVGTISDGNNNSLEWNGVAGTIDIILNKLFTLTVPDIVHNVDRFTYNVKDHGQINTPTIAITNDTAELLQTLSDLVQANIDEQHIGNLKIPTKLTSSSISTYEGIKNKIDSFIK